MCYNTNSINANVLSITINIIMTFLIILTNELRNIFFQYCNVCKFKLLNTLYFCIILFSFITYINKMFYYISRSKYQRYVNHIFNNHISLYIMHFSLSFLPPPMYERFAISYANRSICYFF